MRWIIIAITSIALTIGLAARVGRPKSLKMEVPSAIGTTKAADLDIEKVREHIRRLSEAPSRLTGYNGAAQAADYILAELKSLGIREVEVDEFPVAAPIVREAFLEASTGVKIPLHPLWPNLARTSQTGPPGISGPLVDVGAGTEPELAGKPIRDSIVVMDWASNVEWMSVPEFGGKAVIFRANDSATGSAARHKFLTVPADIPRFYVASEDLPALDAVLGSNVTVRCEMAWENAPAKNILVRVSGSDRPVRANDIDLAPIIFHAYYDSISLVPDLAPGAEQACGAAALLELARYFNELPAKPARPVYLLFTGAHGEAMTGMTRFVRRLKDGLATEWSGADRGLLLARMGRPGLFVGLDLSSHSDRLGVFCVGSFRGQSEFQVRPKFSVVGLKLEEYVKKYCAGSTVTNDLPSFVDGINLTQGRGWFTYFPFLAGFESELPVIAGFPGITLATINDDRRLVDTPADRFENVQIPMLERQLISEPGRRVGLANLALGLAFWKGPFVSSELDDQWARLRGSVVWLDQQRDYTPSQPLTEAVVVLKRQQGDKYLVGTRGVPTMLADEKGHFEFDGLKHVSNPWDQFKCRVEAYGVASAGFVNSNQRAMDELFQMRGRKGEVSKSTLPLDGSIIYALDMARGGEYPWETVLLGKERDLTLVTFPCETITLYGLTDPRGYIALKDLQILEASTQSPPFQFGQSVTDSSWANPEENCVTLWADPTIRLRLTLGHGYQEKRLVLINNSPGNPIGDGFVLGDLKSIPSMVLRGASDIWSLDEWRMQQLHTHGINNPRVKKLHDTARDDLREAETALAGKDYGAYRRASERAWALESKAYGEVLATTNDMIRGVLFYLALLLPFSYSLEKLLFASGTIRRRITGMVVIFTTSFVVLAVVHPAFQFTMTPLLVLLAFVILALATTVSLLLVGKFDTLLKERKTAIGGLHEEARSTGNVALRAIDLGIANIRRRPQRGFLTAMTIVLVTFTLLSFTSLVPETNITQLKYPLGIPVYKGLLARQRNWKDLPRPLYDSLKRSYAATTARAATGIVAARGWYFSDFSGDLSQIDLTVAAFGEDGVDGPRSATAATTAGGHFTAVSLLCLESTEPAVTGVDKALVAGRWFKDEDELGIILPLHVANNLGLGRDDIGRQVIVFGQALPLIGLVDESRFNEIKDIDGEPLMPVNFVLQQERTAERGNAQEKSDTLEEYTHYASDRIAIVPLMFGRQLGATLRSVAVKTSAGVDPATEAKGFVKRSNQTIVASDGEKVTLYAAMDTASFAAAGQIGVPVLLGFVMVFGTMLGSVYERRREIFVFNSVGLSPTNVASLFLAESMVYAILGAGVGYLLGQVVSRILLATGALSGLSLNYSAGTTVITTVLTMVIVLSSTIYPARQAFLAAMPESEGESDSDSSHAATDTISFYLPFVATPSSVFAMQAYMREYLDGIQGITIGQLAVDDIKVLTETVSSKPSPVLSFRAWLAPFDLGISQDSRLSIVYREDRGVYQYHLTAARVSGDQQSWNRLTPRFIVTIRKQLLMWRILSAEAHQRYAEQGERLFGKQQA